MLPTEKLMVRPEPRNLHERSDMRERHVRLAPDIASLIRATFENTLVIPREGGESSALAISPTTASARSGKMAKRAQLPCRRLHERPRLLILAANDNA
jgi:hypothetical protein